MGERQLRTYIYMPIVITLNTYHVKVMFKQKCYIIYVQDPETDNCGTICDGNIHKIMTLMEVENQKEVVKLFSALAIITFIQRNE